MVGIVILVATVLICGVGIAGIGLRELYECERILREKEALQKENKALKERIKTTSKECKDWKKKAHLQRSMGQSSRRLPKATSTKQDGCQ